MTTGRPTPVGRRAPRKQKRCQLPRPVDGGLLQTPNQPDPWADPGLLAYRDPASCDTPAAPQTLREFIREAFPRYGFHRWAELLIERLQAVADGELGRLIVTCPPRLGKSLLVSKLFPAYFIQRHPQLFAAIASYSAELAYAHSREARHYYRLTGNLLSKDSAAVGNWLTPQRGGCIAAGVRGPFTGKGYSLGIIDDPYKGPEDAKSALQRERLIDWLRSVWLTRAEPAEVEDPNGKLRPNLSAQVIVLTRWDHLDLPAIAEPPEDRPTFPPTCTLVPDWRKPGEALCPERFPLGELLKIRARLGSYWWQALYQQRPSPASGSIFLRAWIRPPFERQGSRHYGPLILSCDLSFKGEEDSDHCGFVLMGLLHPDPKVEQSPNRQATRQGHGAGAIATPVRELEIEVLWAARHRFGLPETVKFLMASMAALQQQGLKPDAVLIEDAANGPAVLQLLRRKVPGLLPITARGSKESRAHAVAPLLEAGQVRFHHRAAPLVEELPRFPKGSKDLVDAFGHGALWLEARYWRGLGLKQGPMPLLLSR